MPTHPTPWRRPPGAPASIRPGRAHGVPPGAVHWLWPALLAIGIGGAGAQNLPPEVDAALQRAKLPRDAVALLVVDAEGRSPPRLSHRAQVPMNPASVMKLVTTYAALELLGPRSRGIRRFLSKARCVTGPCTATCISRARATPS